MTRKELLSLKEFGSNLGYLVYDKYSNKEAFTLRYPICGEFDVVLDCTYHDGFTFSISTQTAYDIINNYEDYAGCDESFNYTKVSLESIKDKLIEKWKEYKTYLNDVKLNQIGEDFK